LYRYIPRYALHSDVARVMYDAGMWQKYATDRLPPEQFMPLLVGLYKLNSVDPCSLKPPGFNP
jgi:hypothetical protein